MASFSYINLINNPYITNGTSYVYSPKSSVGYYPTLWSSTVQVSSSLLKCPPLYYTIGLASKDIDGYEVEDEITIDLCCDRHLGEYGISSEQFRKLRSIALREGTFAVPSEVIDEAGFYRWVAANPAQIAHEKLLADNSTPSGWKLVDNYLMYR